MLSRILLAVIVAIVTALICILLGVLLMGLNVNPAVAAGAFLKTYAGLLGLLAGIWFYLTGRTL